MDNTYNNPHPYDKLFVDNIEKLTIENDKYRKVLFTTPNLQLVVMNLLPKEEIGQENHATTTQFIRIESGECNAIINGKTIKMKDNDAIIINPNTNHNIINTSDDKPLKLYSIYSPPEHPADRVQENKPESDNNKMMYGGAKNAYLKLKSRTFRI